MILPSSFMNTDAKDYINYLKDKQIKIDLVLTDIPYNISKENNFHTLKGRKGIDFGEWDKNFDTTSWLNNIKDILSPNASILIFCSWRQLNILADKLETQDITVKNVLRWEKSNPMIRNKNRLYITDYEFILWGVNKKSKWTFNLPPNTTYLTPKFVFSGTITKRIHPTQKPAKLISQLIQIHSNINDNVLDCFAGSGTILMEADKLKRNFYGCELDKNYYDLAVKRIEEMWTQGE